MKGEKSTIWEKENMDKAEAKEDTAINSYDKMGFARHGQINCWMVTSPTNARYERQGNELWRAEICILKFVVEGPAF
jgi:hypothetical protein